MDISITAHSIPAIIPIHFLTMSFAFLICYPYSITQQSHPSCQKRHLISLILTVLLTFVGLVTGWFIQYSTTTSSSDTILLAALKLSLFLLTSFDLVLEYSSFGFSILYQHKHPFHFLEHHHHQQPDHYRHQQQWLSSLMSHVPEIVKVSIKGITLCLGYFYLVFSVFVLTSSVSLGQCWLPLMMGIGFILYGSLAFMHLVNIITLDQYSNVEYYEALVMVSWGFLSLMWWNTPILGSSWKAINVGLLWTTGGILSLAVAFQSWMPMLQKRNVINSIIICLTGKGILSGYANDDDYADELQTTLGYILIIGSVARLVQIVFRKSTNDNLPRLYARASGDHDSRCDDMGGDDDATCVDDLDIGKRRENDYELTYRQLTGMTAKSTSSSTATTCKHQSVYASITMVCGVLSCFMAVSGGIVFIGTIPGWVAKTRSIVSDPSIYVNVLLATSFLWTAYLLALCSLYKASTNSAGLDDYLDVAGYSELPMSSKSPPSPPGSYYDTYNMTSTMTASTSSTSSLSQTSQQTTFSSIPSTSCTRSAPPLSKTSSNGSSTSASSPPMRPSQYRAKRRSLLISTSMQNNNSQDNVRAVRTASTSGPISVGGVLPDEVSIYGDFYASSPVATVSLEQQQQQQQQASTATGKDDAHGHQNTQPASTSTSSSPTFQRRSWRSSASSLLSFSPPRMTGSSSNTLTSTMNAEISHSSFSSSWHQQHQHQQALNHGEDGSNYSTQSLAVYKTESGKRKERQWKNAKRPQVAAAAATATINGNSPHLDEQQQQQDDGCSISGISDGRSHCPQGGSSDCISSDSRIF